MPKKPSKRAATGAAKTGNPATGRAKRPGFRRAEAELRAAAAEIMKGMTPEQARDFATAFALAAEREIRAIPGHPSIPLLDEYYARKRSQKE